MIAYPSSLHPPGIITFNTVLAACVNAGDYDGAQALLEQMRDGMFPFPSRGTKGQSKMVEIKPDVVSYNSVVSCAFDIAMYLLDLAREEKTDINVFVYSTTLPFS